ncbi:MAG: hypothetical protein LBG79_04460 [Spirochaetaceae bacterium]|jgi:hypothetical protein|nr:hypothetical protein [Spirochaetaceae bacterium]GMO22615.1 MAG: hypothetical protein Pg6A_09860 [Termitinemataceae bacterium]
MKHIEFFVFYTVIALAFSSVSCKFSPILESVPGQMDFWCTVNTNDDIKSRYIIERVFMSDKEGVKVGMMLGPLGERFKIIVPKELEGKQCSFTVEFARESSFLDEMDVLKDQQLALNILKSFFYTTPEDCLFTVPENGGELEVSAFETGTARAIEIKDLTMGHSRHSIDVLSNIINLPPIYKIEIFDNNLIGGSMGYSPYIGFATVPPVEIRRSDLLIIDPNRYTGFCIGDDWYLVLNDKTKKEGDPVTITLIWTKPDSIPKRYKTDISLPAAFGTIVLRPNFLEILD